MFIHAHEADDMVLHCKEADGKLGHGVPLPLLRTTHCCVLVKRVPVYQWDEWGEKVSIKWQSGQAQICFRIPTQLTQNRKVLSSAT
jgi:hypothetical protein